MFSSLLNKDKSVAAFVLDNGKFSKLFYVPQPSPSFKNKVQRFKPQNQQKFPGPGYYNVHLEQKAKKAKNYKSECFASVKEIIKKQRGLAIPTIPTNKYGYQLKQNKIIGKKKPQLSQISNVRVMLFQNKKIYERPNFPKKENKSLRIIKAVKEIFPEARHGHQDSMQVMARKYKWIHHYSKSQQQSTEVDSQLNVGGAIGREKGMYKLKKLQPHRTQFFDSGVSRFQ